MPTMPHHCTGLCKGTDSFLISKTFHKSIAISQPIIPGEFSHWSGRRNITWLKNQ